VFWLWYYSSGQEGYIHDGEFSQLDVSSYLNFEGIQINVILQQLLSLSLSFSISLSLLLSSF
jgi:hypothetical protein